MGLAASKATSLPKGGKIEQFSLAGLCCHCVCRFQAGCSGTRGDSRATACFPQAPSFAVTQAVLEVGLK